MLANCLKTILPHIIFGSQSAFILGRLIFDNILAAYETMHSMQTHMWSKTGFMGFKLDMHKAYDWVEWNFLEAAMIKMGFEALWVQIVMTCVTLVQFAVLVNGSLSEWFRPSRGIRALVAISLYWFPSLFIEKISQKLTKITPQ